MEPIYPLTEENLDRFRGQLVCVVMQDGTRHVGILSRCRGGRLVLNDDADCEIGEIAGQRTETGGKRRTRRRAGTRKGRGKEERAQAAGFGWGGPYYGGPRGGGYYGYFGPRLLLDLALIALVLLIL